MSSTHNEMALATRKNILILIAVLVIIAVIVLSVVFTRKKNRKVVKAYVEKMKKSFKSRKASSSRRPPPPLKIEQWKSNTLEYQNRVRDRLGLKKLSWNKKLAQKAQEWADWLKKNYNCYQDHPNEVKKHGGTWSGSTPDMDERGDVNELEKEYLYVDGEKVGQNIAFKAVAGTNATLGDVGKSAVQGWYCDKNGPEVPGGGGDRGCECSSYEDGGWGANPQVGHYTQIVWPETTEVGCGMVECDACKGGNFWQNLKGTAFEGKAKCGLMVCDYSPAGNVNAVLGKKFSQISSEDDCKFVVS